MILSLRGISLLIKLQNSLGESYMTTGLLGALKLPCDASGNHMSVCEFVDDIWSRVCHSIDNKLKMFLIQ